MLKIAQADAVGTFRLKVYSIPWGHGVEEYGVSLEIISATVIKLFHTQPTPNPTIVPVDSIFYSASGGNFAIIFIFTFFN